MSPQICVFPFKPEMRQLNLLLHWSTLLVDEQEGIIRYELQCCLQFFIGTDFPFLIYIKASMAR